MKLVGVRLYSRLMAECVFEDDGSFAKIAKLDIPEGKGIEYAIEEAKRMFDYMDEQMEKKKRRRRKTND